MVSIAFYLAQGVVRGSGNVGSHMKTHGFIIISIFGLAERNIFKAMAWLGEMQQVSTS